MYLLYAAFHMCVLGACLRYHVASLCAVNGCESMRKSVNLPSFSRTWKARQLSRGNLCKGREGLAGGEVPVAFLRCAKL